MKTQFAELTREALLHVAGPDSLTFLQGQTTCDTRDVSAGRAVPGAYCTVQGRMVCDFLLAELGQEHYGLRMRRDLLHVASTTFAKYIVFSRADMDADRSDWHVYGCWGDGASELLASTLGAAPGAIHGVHGGDEGIRVVQLDEDGRHFEVWLQERVQAGVVEALAGATEPAAEAQWEAARILAGIARVEDATSNLFLPQDLNYDRIGWVNFRKGCYTGQEIVARLHYRGTPKRRTYPARLNGAVAQAGDALYTADRAQSVGHVVNASATDDDAVALVCAAVNALEQPLHLGAEDGPALSLLDLPYSLDP